MQADAAVETAGYTWLSIHRQKGAICARSRLWKTMQAMFLEGVRKGEKFFVRVNPKHMCAHR